MPKIPQSLAIRGAHNLTHEQRRALIDRPFPPLRQTVPGRIWAGNLITHDDMDLFIKGQKEHQDTNYEEAS